MSTRTTNPNLPAAPPDAEGSHLSDADDDVQPIDALRIRLGEAVCSFCQIPALLNATLQVLNRPGYALHADSPWQAGLLCLESFRAVNGALEAAALDAAVAVELRMEAGYLFDRVGDGQVEPKGGLTSAEELTVAITLMSCSSAVASDATRDLDSDALREDCMAEFHRGTISSCAGQFLDASLEKLPSATLNEAVEMTWLKAGSLGKSSAGFGASIAGAGQDVVDALGEFGFNLFTCAQLVDDVRDAEPDPDPSSDISRNKKTVPLVCSVGETGDESGRMDSRRAVDESTAQTCGVVLAEVFLNRARRCLDDLRARDYRVAALERFVETVEARSQSAGATS